LPIVKKRGILSELEIIRNKIYILLLHETSIHELFNNITDKILIDIDDNNKIKKILKAAVYYNENCNLGYRDIYHFESYILYVINILNNNNVELINDII